MAWTFPNNWADGNVPSGADLNKIRYDLEHWGGNVDAGGYSLLNLLSVQITGNTFPALQLSSVNADVALKLANSGAGGHTYRIESSSGASGYGQGLFCIVDEAAPGTPRLAISPSGNVGIGTVTPGFRLSVEGGRSTFASNADRYAIGLLYQAGGPVAWIGTDLNGDHIFSEAGGAERMRIKATGNVGIGAGSPNAILDLQGAKYGAPSTSGSASGDQNLRIGASGHGEVLDFGNAGSPWIQARNSINFASNFALLLNPNGGNVGIGTLNPTAALSVVGLTVHANNATAIAAGKAAGAFYRNGADPDVVCVVH